jgi:hypothetical protein
MSVGIGELMPAMTTWSGFSRERAVPRRGWAVFDPGQIGGDIILATIAAMFRCLDPSGSAGAAHRCRDSLIRVATMNDGQVDCR